MGDGRRLGVQAVSILVALPVADAVGLTIPPSLLLRADQAIE